MREVYRMMRCSREALTVEDTAHSRHSRNRFTPKAAEYPLLRVGGGKDYKRTPWLTACSGELGLPGTAEGGRKGRKGHPKSVKRADSPHESLPRWKLRGSCKSQR